MMVRAVSGELQASSSPAIEVMGLTKLFGQFRAVDDVSFTIPRGEIFGLLGSNGAGKSTLIRMLCGLLRPSSGSARIQGIDIATETERARGRIGYMSQKFSLYDDLTVRQNLDFFGGVYGLAGTRLEERQQWALRIAGLERKADDGVRTLSGGWKQRLALVSALLHEPDVVFLDEPTGGVDPISRRAFWSLINEMAEQGVTLLVTTHYLDEAEHCHRIALIHAGRMVALGSVSELKEVFGGRAILEVTCPRFEEALRLLEQDNSVLETTVFGTALHLVVRDPEDSIRHVRELLESSGNTPATVERIVPSLEDVFIHTVQHAEKGRR